MAYVRPGGQEKKQCRRVARFRLALPALSEFQQHEERHVLRLSQSRAGERPADAGEVA